MDQIASTLLDLTGSTLSDKQHISSSGRDDASLVPETLRSKLIVSDVESSQYTNGELKLLKPDSVLVGQLRAQIDRLQAEVSRLAQRQSLEIQPSNLFAPQPSIAFLSEPGGSYDAKVIGSSSHLSTSLSRPSNIRDDASGIGSERPLGFVVNEIPISESRPHAFNALPLRDDTSADGISDADAETARLHAEIADLRAENVRLRQADTEPLGILKSDSLPLRREFGLRQHSETDSAITFPLLYGERDVIATIISCVNRCEHSATFKASVQLCGRTKYVALKAITVRSGREQEVWREVNAWSAAGRFRVQPLLGVLREDYGHVEEHILASPWAENGNMLRYLQQRPEVCRKSMIKQVADALDYLHSNLKIVHGDIKCENVLIDERGDAMLTDFGLSTFVSKQDEEVTTATSVRSRFTIDFCAPELWIDEVSDGKRKRSKSLQTDVYAYGMLVLQAFTLERPWGNVQNPVQLVITIANGALPPRPEPGSAAVRHGFDDRIWDMCLQCWRHSPEKRPSMSTILSLLRKTQRGASSELSPSYLLSSCDCDLPRGRKSPKSKRRRIDIEEPGPPLHIDSLSSSSP